MSGGDKSDMSCQFCQIPPERIIAQNEHAFAIRDAFPVSPGHTLIISKRHVGSFFETTQEEKIALLELLDEAQQALRISPCKVGGAPQGYKWPEGRGGHDPSVAARHLPCYAGEDAVPDAFNIGINDGAAAGQTVPHLHIHLIPRYKNDVEDPRGGVRWVMPEKADYWSGQQ